MSEKIVNFIELIFPVDFTTVTGFNHYDQQIIINNIQYYPIFTNAMSVEGVTFCPFYLFYVRIGLILNIMNR